MSKRIPGILAVIVVIFLLMEMTFQTRQQENKEAVEPENVSPLLVWYTDPDIQTYMEETAAEASKSLGVEIQTELVSEVDYMENISEKSMAEEMTGPDLYVAATSQLGKAAQAGLALPAEQSQIEKTYGEKALHAVIYNGNAVAVPFYVETSVLLYNPAYVESAPQTIDEILNYAENFETNETTEAVENIFNWNVADIIEDYMFMGGYTDLGGEDGDRKDEVILDLDQINACMAYYQNLNSFFAIDADTITSDAIMQDFLAGKTVYVIANESMLSQADQAIREGKVPEGFYSAAVLPDLTEELISRGLSVTTSVVVNPYSQNQDAAWELVSWITEKGAGSLYENAGKLPACRTLAEAPTPAWETVCEAYDQAAEVPKLMELSDLWLNLELTLADIWRGEDPSEQMQAFSEELIQRLD